MRRTRHLRHGAWAIALAAALVFSAQASEADEWYPGLPDPPADMGQSYQAASQSGLSYAKRAKQWFRTADAMVTFNAITPYEGNNGIVSKMVARGRAIVVSPPGAPAPYGYLPPMTVRSVGFGLMPVEATVQVSQRRENGYPVPFQVKMTGRDYFGKDGNIAYTVMDDTVVEEALNVQILAVRVDGVDLGLTGDCRTVTPAPVRMVGTGTTRPSSEIGVEEWYASLDPATFYHPLWGGQLNGTLTIPPFTGCTTAAGDDLSDLMTLSVSGPDNPVSARTGWPCARTVQGVPWPLAPGQATPESTIADGWKPTGKDTPGCERTKKFVYPERPSS